MESPIISLQKRLTIIQHSLKAPKSQTNAFGKYKYRSCEDILEALKPLLYQQGVTLMISDSIELVGKRFYVKATARLSLESEAIESTAYAREAEDKKGMDESQITGAASSYARKYALNGLFCIDDTEDADTRDNTKQVAKVTTLVKVASTSSLETIGRLCATLKFNQADVYAKAGVVDLKPTEEQAAKIIKVLTEQMSKVDVAPSQPKV